MGGHALQKINPLIDFVNKPLDSMRKLIEKGAPEMSNKLRNSRFRWFNFNPSDELKKITSFPDEKKKKETGRILPRGYPLS